MFKEFPEKELNMYINDYFLSWIYEYSSKENYIFFSSELQGDWRWKLKIQ